MDDSAISRHLEDCDRRLLTLEGLAKYLDDENASLRSSRHEHGNWLNRHNLEIAAIQQAMVFRGGEIQAMKETLMDVSKTLSSVVSDSRIMAWKIGAIMAALLFVANQLASRIHF